MYFVQIIDYRNNKTHTKSFPTEGEAIDQVFKSLGKLYTKLGGRHEGYAISGGPEEVGVHIRRGNMNIYTIEHYHN